MVQHWLPAHCLLCGTDPCPTVVCAACCADLPLLPAPRCPRCALPTPSSEVCGHCLREPPIFDRCLAPWQYAFPVDRLIQMLKYQHRLPLANWLGQQLCSVWDPSTLPPDGIIPLPLHPQRLAERGFNQSLEIARVLTRQFGWPLASGLLHRTRPTAPQAAQPLKQRATNVRGAFACSSDLSGRHLLLIDDVLTTGATANECARTLKLHGAAEVSVLVCARALPA